MVPSSELRCPIGLLALQVVDKSRGKLEVAPCFLPTAARSTRGAREERGGFRCTLFEGGGIRDVSCWTFTWDD